jgi:stage III sporulation protein AG
MELNQWRAKALELVRKYKYVLIVLLVGVGLMLIPERKHTSEPVQMETAPSFSDSTEALTQILSQIQGAGKVKVLLTVSAGEQTVYQIDQTVDGSGRVDSETVIITDADRDQQGLVQKILAPEYRGAIVLCQGAEDAAVRLSIVEAVSDVTGLSTDRISVLKMK